MKSTNSVGNISPRPEHIIVGGFPTYVVKTGHSRNGNILALIIPGNPGIADYYNEYMVKLVEQSKNNLPVWCVSHAGHVSLPKDFAAAEAAAANTDFTSLEGQIKHKVQFIMEHIPQSTKLILIGHSIGAYIILHMLKELPEEQVVKCQLLFPTVERLALSSQGKVATPMLRYLRWLAPIGIYPFSFLSDSIIDKVLRWYFGKKNVPDCTIEATKRLICPRTIRCITDMANEEMQKVITADYHLIEKYLEKLMFYYGASDHWCPIEYFEDMKAQYPNGNIILCQKGFDHAFVLESSENMAHISWKWLAEDIANIE